MTNPTRETQAGDAKAEARSIRRKRYFSGLSAERLAAIWLLLKGYRILGSRVRTPSGEIDLIAIRGSRLAFIEVKRRATLELAQASITGKQRQRVRRAADLWLARNPRFQNCDISFDLVFLLPRKLPRHLPNAL